MNRYVKSNEGVTLLELLIALSISTMLIGLLYGVMNIGIKSYKKVAIENQLRDEADLIITEIMNVFYESSADSLENSCVDPEANDCIIIKDNESISVEFEGEDNEVSIINKNASKESGDIRETTIKIKNNNIYIDDRQINSTEVKLSPQSSLEGSCKNATTIQDNIIVTRCISALVDVKLEVRNKNYKENSIYDPILNLESRFGF